MKIMPGTTRHGFTALNVSACGKVRYWECDACGHYLALFVGSDLDQLKTHTETHKTAWPFPRFEIDDVPTSPVWRRA